MEDSLQTNLFGDTVDIDTPQSNQPTPTQKKFGPKITYSSQFHYNRTTQDKNFGAYEPFHSTLYPIRCYSCGNVIESGYLEMLLSSEPTNPKTPDEIDMYNRLIEKKQKVLKQRKFKQFVDESEIKKSKIGEIMDELGYYKNCCRNIIATTPYTIQRLNDLDRQKIFENMEQLSLKDTSYDTEKEYFTWDKIPTIVGEDEDYYTQGINGADTDFMLINMDTAKNIMDLDAYKLNLAKYDTK